MKTNKKSKKTIPVICAAAVLMLVLLVFRLAETAADRRIESSNEMPGVSQSDLDNLSNGAQGKTAVLLIGIDKFQSELKSVGFMNNQQSDFVTLLIFNHEEQSFAAIHFNRDTICDVIRYGIGGKKADTVPMQLALSHTYGDGGAMSCRNTVQSVNSIVPGINIKNYACVTMEAVVGLTDLCGGIPVLVDDDYTMVDPSLQKGLTVTLDGEAALRFIRMRQELYDGSNVRRMDRQRTYLCSLADRLIKTAGADSDFAMKAVDTVSPYLTTDAGDVDLAEYMSWLISYQFTGIVTPEGTLDDSGEYVEFYPDPASIQEITGTYWKN